MTNFACSISIKTTLGVKIGQLIWTIQEDQSLFMSAESLPRRQALNHELWFYLNMMHQKHSHILNQIVEPWGQILSYRLLISGSLWFKQSLKWSVIWEKLDFLLVNCAKASHIKLAIEICTCLLYVLMTRIMDLERNGTKTLSTKGIHKRRQFFPIFWHPPPPCRPFILLLSVGKFQESFNFWLCFWISPCEDRTPTKQMHTWRKKNMKNAWMDQFKKNRNNQGDITQPLFCRDFFCIISIINHKLRPERISGCGHYLMQWQGMNVELLWNYSKITKLSFEFLF